MKILTEKEMIEEKMNGHTLIYILGTLACLVVFLIFVSAFGGGVIFGFTLGGLFVFFIAERAEKKYTLMKDFEKAIRKVKK